MFSLSLQWKPPIVEAPKGLIWPFPKKRIFIEVSSGKKKIYLESFVRISSALFKLSTISTNSCNSCFIPFLAFLAFCSLHFVRGVPRSFDFAALPHYPAFRVNLKKQNLYCVRYSEDEDIWKVSRGLVQLCSSFTCNKICFIKY